MSIVDGRTRVRNRIARAALAVCLAGCGPCDRERASSEAGEASESTAPKPPQNPPDAKWNVLFFLSDALRAASLPMHGYPRDTAPRLRALAAEGIVFERHYSAATYTRGSVSQMFTGTLFAPALMATQHTEGLEHELPDDVPIFPRLLRGQGYVTTIVSSHPWFNETARVMPHFEHQTLVKQSGYAPYEELLEPTRAALRSAAKSDKPFFLYVHSMDTHHPYRMHEGFKDHVGDGKADRRYDKYDSEIRYTDHHIGLILDELEALGLSDRTLVVVTSDHGEEFHELGGGWRNVTHGSNVRRAATHIPFIVRLPKAIRRTGRFEDVTSHIDVTPTLARLAAPATDLSKYRHDGEDLSQRVLRGDHGATVRTVYSRSGRYFGLRQGVRPNLDVIYDRWADKVRVYAHDPDRSNYPRPRKVRGKDNRPADLIAQVLDVANNARNHFRTFPPRARKPASKSIFPTLVAKLTDHTPNTKDGKRARWSLRPGRYLKVGPGADPGRVTLRSGIAPGRYAVSVKLHPRYATRYRNGFRMAIDGAKGKPIVYPPKKRQALLLAAGTHELPDHFQVTIDQPDGGVAIAGFALKYLGDDEQEQVEPVDPALTEQLRALGYVE
jgi:arylsulfatase A-like enzyme